MSATPPRADLRTLAAEAIRQLRGPHGPLEDGSFWTKMGSDDELADAVLAAVLPEHRRMVLAEAAEALCGPIEWQREHYGTPAATADRVEVIAYGRLFGLEDALGVIRRLAAAAPETTLSATVPAETAPAVPEATPGGFHEPDEPTGHVQAAFDAGTHRRTAPPRGQTQRLDVAAPNWREMAGRWFALADDADWLTAWLAAHGLSATAGPGQVVRAVARDLQAWAVTGGRQAAAERDVVEAAKAWYAACDPNAITAPDVRAAGIQLAAAVDALLDTPLRSPSTGTPAPKATAKDADPTEGWEPTFFERRASRDPSIDHSSHSTQWVGKCPECPSDTAPEGADEMEDDYGV